MMYNINSVYYRYTECPQKSSDRLLYSDKRDQTKFVGGVEEYSTTRPLITKYRG